MNDDILVLMIKLRSCLELICVIPLVCWHRLFLKIKLMTHGGVSCLNKKHS